MDKEKRLLFTTLLVEIIVISALIAFTIFEILVTIMSNQTYTFAAVVHANANQTAFLLQSDYQEALYFSIFVGFISAIMLALFVATLKEYMKSD